MSFWTWNSYDCPAKVMTDLNVIKTKLKIFHQFLQFFSELSLVSVEGWHNPQATFLCLQLPEYREVRFGEGGAAGDMGGEAWHSVGGETGSGEDPVCSYIFSKSSSGVSSS